VYKIKILWLDVKIIQLILQFIPINIHLLKGTFDGSAFLMTGYFSDICNFQYHFLQWKALFG